jgi:UDP-glucose:(heptosyl)LPS alpha-1,3-glucosyltransferase
MKLALIRRQFSAVGGAELYVQRLLGGLADAGHEVHLYAEKWEGEPRGVTLHQVPVRGGRALRPVIFAENVDRMLAAGRHDLVFSLERTVRQDVYRAGDGVHAVWLEQRRRYASWWRRPFVGLGAFHASMKALEARTFDPANTRRIIVNSEMVGREITARFPFPADRIHLVRNGVNVARFQNGDRAATRARFGFTDDDFILLFVGSGWERKGLAFLLRIMRQWEGAEPRMKLLVVGKGRLAGRVPSNVVLAGSTREVEHAFAAADLMTFLPVYEPCANVIAEALAAGLPVITSRSNGACELIDEGVSGHVLDDPADLAGLEKAVRFWRARPEARPVPVSKPLDIATNVRETLRILELAAEEKRRLA